MKMHHRLKIFECRWIIFWSKVFGAEPYQYQWWERRLNLLLSGEID